MTYPCETNPNRWFRDHITPNQARKLCEGCPIAVACLGKAISDERGLGIKSRHGVWGGTTPRQRWAADKTVELKPGSFGAFAVVDDEAVTHGTFSGYKRGCRCSECVEVKRAHQREYRQRRKLQKVAS